MRNRLKYLNSIEHLSVSNSKESVYFYIFNYTIGDRSLKQFIPREGFTLKKEGLNIKDELDKMIQQIEKNFILSYSEFLCLLECLDKFKTYNMKYKVSVENDEIVVFFDKQKTHEPNNLKDFSNYFYKDNDSLCQRYVNSDKFYITPLWNKENPTIEDYLNYFEKALSTVHI
ncbi:hypothetical protein CVD28_00815 [Bacillus sp. M6-12]|uniref:hypothetical protein n=1 Tax=Bacillus sp. M6-12 TaxID=2054166 RepID=UPI000C786025|nr:hypothetical protein [Bacillus sp. M6-12]PLS18975.1 hypothetical protein CVD28_00815 [Bacillus sp. M6-12]